MRQRVTGPDSGEAEEQLAEGVDGRVAELPAAGEGEGVQPERREGRESAQDADHDERAPGFTHVNAARGDEAGHDADRKAAGHVHQEDAERKCGSEPHLHQMVGEVAEKSAHAAAHGNRQ